MNFTQKLLAGALLAALPLGSALACTTGAWSGTTGNPVADDPDGLTTTNGPTDNGHVKRYAGNCGMAPAAGAASLVTNDTVADATYRARFYFFSGIATGSPKLFEAYDADAGGGTALFSVTYDRANNELDFAVNNTTMQSIPVTASRWYSVEFFHNSGNPLQVSVEGGNTTVADAAAVTRASAAALAGTVQSARLGNVNGSALTFGATPALSNNHGFSVDEFDSTRSATTAIGRLCRGDANNNANAALGDNDLSALDAGAIIAEALNTAVAPGQPDANEDGRVTALDAGLVINMRLQNKKCN